MLSEVVADQITRRARMQLPAIAVDWTWCVFIPGEKTQGKIWSGIGIAFLFTSKFFSTYLSEKELVPVSQECQPVKEAGSRRAQSSVCSLHKISLKALFRQWFRFKRRFIKRNRIFQSERHYRHFNNMKMGAQGMMCSTSCINYFGFNLQTNFYVQWGDLP